MSDNIETLIAANIQLIQAGQEVEHAKLEFKSEWYNLKDERGIAAFIKDASAIANTVGPDGYLVIGYDTDSNQYKPAKFSDSGLRDSSQLPDIIVKHVDRAFRIDCFPIEVDGNILNVIHIPPSLDKPHVIRNHKSWPGKGDKLREEVHRTFVRYGSRIREATKYDLDLMYYDRKNIQPEHQVYGTIDFSSIQLFASPQKAPNNESVDRLSLSLPITLENTGRRTLLINRFSLSLRNTLNPVFPSTIDFVSTISFTNFVLKHHEIQELGVKFVDRSLNGYPISITKIFVSDLLNNLPNLLMQITLRTSNNIDIPVIH